MLEHTLKPGEHLSTQLGVSLVLDPCNALSPEEPWIRTHCGSQIHHQEQSKDLCLRLHPCWHFQFFSSMKLPVLSYLSAACSLLFMGKCNSNLSKKIFVYDHLKTGNRMGTFSDLAWVILILFWLSAVSFRTNSLIQHKQFHLMQNLFFSFTELEGGNSL